MRTGRYLAPKKTAEAGRGGEALYRLVFNSMVEGFALHEIVVDSAGVPTDYRFLAVNPAFERLTGLVADAVVGRTVREVLPGLGDEWIERYGRVALDGESMRFEHYAEPLDRFYDVTAFSPSRGQFATIFTDITERRRLEEALRNNGDRFKRLSEVTFEGLVITEQGRIVDTNRRFSDMLGYRPEEIAGRAVMDLVFPEDRDTVREKVQNAVEAPYQVRVLRKDGTIRHVEVQARHEKDGDRTLRVASLRDLTEQRLAEEALCHSEAKYRSLVRNATYGIYRAGGDGRFLTVNPALVGILGYDSEVELHGLDASTDIYAKPELWSQAAAHFRGTGASRTFETEWKRKDGSIITVRLSGRAVYERGDASERFEVIVDDVTGQRTLEAQLRHAQKMEEIGRLAGGLAHDLNNLLTVILANVELMDRSLPPGRSDLASEVAEVRTACDQGRDLIRRLLGFSRRQSLRVRSVSLGPVVNKLTSMLRRLVPATIFLDTTVDERAPSVRIDTGALEQIVMNLVTNGRDAMPNGGSLRIDVFSRTRTIEDTAGSPGTKPGEYGCVAVTDTGQGMDAKTRERLFEPFFTTKRAGQGTGLGMAMVYGLVKQQGGHVHVQSTPGKGTRIELWFPAAMEEAKDEPQEAPRVTRSEQPRPGGQTVLIADDGAPIRQVARRALERVGYQVLVAGNGQEAIDLLRAGREPVHLLITDLVMPKMGGRQLVATLRQEGMTLPVIYSSGYADQDVREREQLDPGVPFLTKPWTLDELYEVVSAALANEAAA